MDITLQDILKGIVSGAADGQEQRIYDAIKTRRSITDAQKIAEFGIGDKVVFNSHASPKYLKGNTVEIVGFKTKNLEIKITEPIRGDSGGKFRVGSVICCPPSIVDKVPA